MKIEGHSAYFVNKQKLLQKLSALEGIETMCEIGFNAGHSALNLLSEAAQQALLL